MRAHTCTHAHTLTSDDTETQVRTHSDKRHKHQIQWNIAYILLLQNQLTMKRIKLKRPSLGVRADEKDEWHKGNNQNKLYTRSGCGVR